MVGNPVCCKYLILPFTSTQCFGGSNHFLGMFLPLVQTFTYQLQETLGESYYTNACHPPSAGTEDLLQTTPSYSLYTETSI